MEYSNAAPPVHRISRVSSRPTLSVVLASVESRVIAESCVAALVNRCERAEAEVIVVRPEGAPLMTSSMRYRSRVHFVTAPALCSTQELRSHGMRAAHGDIVVILEDVPGMELHMLDRMVALATDDSTASGEMSDVVGRPFDRGGASAWGQELPDIARAIGET